MNKKIEAILKDILRRVKLEKDQTQPAIAKAEIQDTNRAIVPYWITRLEKSKTYIFDKDFNGNITRVNIVERDDTNRLEEPGSRTICRDSPMGGFIIQNGLGTGTFKITNKLTKATTNTELTILSLTNYTPHPKEEDATDVEVKALNPSSENKPNNSQELKHNVNSIKKTFEKLEKITREISELTKKKEAAEEAESVKIQQEISDKNKKRQQIEEEINQFFKISAGLKIKPILDTFQEAHRRTEIFDNCYKILNGGPGTGKTTTLIQRITFLTSRSILESLEFNETQKFSEEDFNILLDDNQKNNWIFFSPTELLRHYLKNAMTDEGLKGDDKRVFTWDTYARNISTNFSLYKTFQNENFGLKFFNLQGNQTKLLLDELKNFILSRIQQNIQNVTKEKIIKNTSWAKEMEELQNRAKNIKPDLSQIFIPFLVILL